jgi:hypothetical protein
MATTFKAFVMSSQGALVTSANAAFAAVLALGASVANALIGSNSGSRIDSQVDLSTAGYAKNGAFFLNLAASTPISVDLTDIDATSTSSAGDDTFAKAFDIQLINPGTQDVIVGAAASHAFLGPLGGTTPTITVAAGSVEHIQSVAGWTIASGTNSILKFDPGGSAAQIAVAIGGQ